MIAIVYFDMDSAEFSMHIPVSTFTIGSITQDIEIFV